MKTKQQTGRHLSLTRTTDSSRSTSLRPLQMDETTGPLGVIRGKRVLVVADVQNLELSARDHRATIAWETLAEVLSAEADFISLHAVMARAPGNRTRLEYFAGCGWRPYAKTTRMERRRGILRRDANADNHVAGVTMFCAATSSIDLVLLGTGDGQLAQDVADLLIQVPSPCPMATLSVAGATSSQLDAATNPVIHANLELGNDCMRRSCYGAARRQSGPRERCCAVDQTRSYS